MHVHLMEINKKIVKKHTSLPLAIETLGSLLHGKVDRNNWKDELNIKVWDLPEARSVIIPALRISYHYLPPHLKWCFICYLLFPKDY